MMLFAPACSHYPYTQAVVLCLFLLSQIWGGYFPKMPFPLASQWVNLLSNLQLLGRKGFLEFSHWVLVALVCVCITEYCFYPKKYPNRNQKDHFSWHLVFIIVGGKKNCSLNSRFLPEMMVCGNSTKQPLLWLQRQSSNYDLLDH